MQSCLCTPAKISNGCVLQTANGLCYCSRLFPIFQDHCWLMFHTCRLWRGISSLEKNIRRWRKVSKLWVRLLGCLVLFSFFAVSFTKIQEKYSFICKFTFMSRISINKRWKLDKYHIIKPQVVEVLIWYIYIESLTNTFSKIFCSYKNSFFGTKEIFLWDMPYVEQNSLNVL